MTAVVMDGVLVRAETVDAIRAGIAAGTSPPACLATVVVGDNPRCHILARDKRRAADEAGLTTVAVDLTGAATQAEVEQAIAELAGDPAVDGILVQLPVSGHLDLDRVIALVPPVKDVDGLRPDSVHAPTTPLAVLRLLDHHGVPIDGRRAVVVGGSPRLARALAHLLTGRGAEVSLLDQAPAAICREADILVAAAGRPRTIGADHVRPGAAVVDLTGDVDLPPVEAVAGGVGPYPVAVGPVAIACLLLNTVDAARARARR
jgi:methylenetetrahydrofolate dehydrogenase (NADP+) / methenyltetrahydrofolate cyclohydrolase